MVCGLGESVDKAGPVSCRPLVDSKGGEALSQTDAKTGGAGRLHSLVNGKQS